jgi:SAM-dependent methyltransferase
MQITHGIVRKNALDRAPTELYGDGMSNAKSAQGREGSRATSFGVVADDYDFYRPGPPSQILQWLFPEPVATVIDVGAGTGALTRLLTNVASTVVAVDPDPEMRRALKRRLPGIAVLDGRGERLPVDDCAADAIVASSSWHWVDPVAGAHEAARVLRPGGLLAALWSGPDPDGAFMAQAQAALSSAGGDRILEGTVSGEFNPPIVLEVPDGAPFGPVEERSVRWTVALTADQLVGLLGTLSWVIVLGDAERARLQDTARRLLRDALGIEGDVTANVEYICVGYRTRKS